MTTATTHRESVPARFEDLVRKMPPRIIRDEAEYGNVIEFLDVLLARPRPSKGQTNSSRPGRC